MTNCPINTNNIGYILQREFRDSVCSQQITDTMSGEIRGHVTTGTVDCTQFTRHFLYQQCVFRHQNPGGFSGDRALVSVDCSQAQPCGANQLSLTCHSTGPVIGRFETVSQSEKLTQPKLARPEQASSSLARESVKQNGG